MSDLMDLDLDAAFCCTTNPRQIDVMGFGLLMLFTVEALMCGRRSTPWWSHYQ